ncbi:MAG: hypothetical protein KMY49_06115 [Hoeflea sp.]|nr:hypothetical protein [Hoeflea sp.]
MMSDASIEMARKLPSEKNDGAANPMTTAMMSSMTAGADSGTFVGPKSGGRLFRQSATSSSARNLLAGSSRFSCTKLKAFPRNQ